LIISQNKKLKNSLISAMLPLPNCVGPDTPRIILGISGGYDVNEYTIEEIMKAFMMVGDIMMEEDDQMIVAGQVNILDLKKATIAHFLTFTPSMMKKMTAIMQEGSPFRLKAIHYVNVPPWFEKMFNVFKGFINDKMKSRVKFNFFKSTIKKIEIFSAPRSWW
jgi:hypothetical protein